MVESTSIKITEETNELLKSMKGYNGCVSIENVIVFLIKFYKEKTSNETKPI